MTLLTPGANAGLPSLAFPLFVRQKGIAGAEVDIAVFLITPTGKVRSDEDMCFYGQPQVGQGTAAMVEGTPTQAQFAIDLTKVPSGVEKLLVTATIHENKATFGALPEITLDIGGVQGAIPCAGKTETALLLAEIYQRNGQWKTRIIGQGFNGGLAALATHLGVTISAPEPTPAPAPAPAPTPAPQPINTNRPSPAPANPAPSLNRPIIPPPAAAPTNAPAAPTPSVRPNLTKVNLTKESRSVSLKKENGRFGKIRINLNWSQQPPAKGLSFFAPKPIDLDLGCFVEDRYGNKTCVQALGGGFGDYNYFPYAKLNGDDRTGAVRDGEWLEINGDMWQEFNRILIFAFIYDGVPNWNATDGVIRIFMPDQPEVEVRMDSTNAQDSMCAVAMLENDGGRITLRREVQFFKGHRFMDAHYNWGMNWTVGRK